MNENDARDQVKECRLKVSELEKRRDRLRHDLARTEDALTFWKRRERNFSQMVWRLTKERLLKSLKKGAWQ